MKNTNAIPIEKHSSAERKKLRQKAYYEKNKHNPEFIEKRKRYKNNYLKRNKDNPAFKEKNKARSTKCYKENPEHYKAYQRAYRKANKDNPKYITKKKALNKTRYDRLKDDPEFKQKSNSLALASYEKNKNDLEYKARVKTHSDAYYRRHKNQPEFKQKRRERNKKFYYTPKGKIRSVVTNVFKRIKQNKTANTFELLGCTCEEAKAHIESLWQPGMTWENHGLHGWHIDHIRPVSSFKEDELHLINHISNLQPLWAKDNLLKRDKWIGRDSNSQSTL